MNNPFKVLITTSGIGARLGEITKFTNKSLVRIGNKPVISYIVEKYPRETNFVITLGYYGDQVRDYLELAYPDISFEFVTVDKYQGKGSSLLYSLSCAKESLQEPFIYHACDTITFSDIPFPSGNWIAGFKGLGSSTYASFSTLGKKVTEMHFRGYINSDFLHIGLVGIHDYAAFWDKADEVLAKRSDDSSIGDVDVLKELVHSNYFQALELNSWFDMGNVDSLDNARIAINDDDFHVLDKLAESIYKVDESIIKFFHDPEILNDRVKRVSYLGDTVPKLTGVKENFYKYGYVEGELFANVANRSNFLGLIGWAEKNLWKPLDKFDPSKFKDDCTEFYVTKTNKRLEDFFAKKNVKDTEDIINQELVPKVSDMLKLIDIGKLCSDAPTGFHGDFILDNIIMVGKDDFKLIDWRQNFAGNLEAGDKYYDLAKLAHNLVVNHELIDNNHFQIDIHQDGSINLNIHRLQTLVECENVYFEYLRKTGVNVEKVLLLRSIIWLNMSPLHHHPFDLFLYYFGKYELAKIIKSGNYE
jgi:hypothetical protein